jgi:myosin heavy chain 6/7
MLIILQKKQFKSSELGQINPPKFEKCEDMANLTFLNDGSVFWNLKTRYQVVTFSGIGGYGQSDFPQ